jgi:hypothetical protein
MQRLSVLTFALLAACELQPAPRQQPAPPAPAPPAPAPVIEATADAGVAAIDAPAAPQWTDQCREVGIHIAAVIISSATDPGAKSIYEQDREKMVRSTAETCTTQAWSDPAAKCYLKANTTAELKACEKKFTPPQPRQRPAADEPETRAGSGSAAAPRAGAGSAAAPRAGAGSAATPRAGAGSAAPRAGAGSAATPRAGAGSAAAPRAGGGSAAAPRPRAGSGSAQRP